MSDESKAPKKTKTIGDFFGVDVDGVRKACELGMNPTVAYMVLACFSDETNRHTKASVKSVTKYTGISPKYAKQAIAALIDARLVGLLPGDSTRPNYEIFGAPPAPPPPRAYGYRKAKLAPAEQVAFESIGKGLVPIDNHARAAARRAVKKGWLIENDDGFAVREAPPPPPPDRTMVWLPNELVKGIGGATPPIQRVCETSDPLVLRILVDLYRLQTLTSDGGIDREVLYRPFESECLGKVEQFNVWAFAPESKICCNEELTKYSSGTQPRHHWDCISLLESIGLIRWYGQLFAAPDGALLHPLGSLFHDKEKLRENDASWIEFQIGMAAREAGVALARHVPKEAPKGSWIIPVLSHIAKPTVVGIARLRYRPKISDTAKWYGTLMGKKEGWIKGFGEVTQMALSMNKKAVNA